MTRKAQVIVSGPFVDALNYHLELTKMRNYEICERMGYVKSQSNLMTMFRKGLTRVPLGKVPALSRVLGVDEKTMLKLWFQQYMPGIVGELEAAFSQGAPTAMSEFDHA